MASVFEAMFAEVALPTMFEQFGIAATYIPLNETAIAVTILVDERGKSTSDKTGSRSTIHTLRGVVRVSEVAALGRGDTFQITGDSIVYRVVPASVRRDGIEWHFEATADVVTTLGDVRTFPNR